jgi:hypothetical protein
MSAGKGDKPRPTDKKTFNDNFDQISWKPTSQEPVKVKKGKKTFAYTSNRN